MEELAPAWLMFSPELIPGVLAFVFGLCVPVSLVVTLFIRRRYKSAVLAEMMRDKATPLRPVEVAAPRRPNGKDVLFEEAQLELKTRLRPAVGLRHAIAGGVYMAVMTVLAVLTSGSADFHPERFAFVFLCSAILPILLGLVAAGIGWIWDALILCGWIVGLALIWPETPVFLWATLGIPMIIVALIANPLLRTTALPIYVVTLILILPALFTLDISILFNPFWSELVQYVPPGILVEMFVWIQTLVTMLILLGLGAWIVSLLARPLGRMLRASSEFMMLSDTAYFILTLWLLSTYWSSLGPAALMVLTTFVAYRVTLHLLRPRPTEQTPLLLLLRVFGNPKAQQTIARTILRDWRANGPVVLIGGTDLAIETLDSDELGAFLARDLSSLFISSAEDFHAASKDRDRPLSDGLYPMADYYCNDNSWRATVERLMDEADEVILDLRGLTPANRGVRFEIDALAARVPAKNIRVLIDEATDTALARSYFTDAFAKAGHGNGPAEIRLLRV